MKFDFVDKIGSVGTVFVAAACPGCWPLFIPLGSALGLTFFEQYEGIMMTYAFPAVVFITLVGSVLAYKVHKSKLPLIVSGVSVALIYIGFYGGMILIPMYIGIFGALIGSILGILAKKQCKIPNAA